MFKVQLALLPALIVHVYFFGYGIVIQWLLGLITFLIVESIMLKLRNRPVLPFISDLTAVITISGIAFCIPPNSSWWLIVTAVSFALIFGKHLYGGMGYNPFNPAMLGYAFILISFPVEITQWSLPIAISGQELTFINTLQLIFTGNIPNINIDQITGATPLNSMKTGLTTGTTILQTLNLPIFDNNLPYAWTQINIAFILGGLWLLFTRAINWQYPIGFLGTIALLATIFHYIDPHTYAPASVHLFSGGIMLAAFFIITDPVTSSTTPKGKLVFAIGIGCLVYIIRNWGAFPDGISFAVLLLNMCVPFIDQYTAPRVVGYKK
jgi:electron transport complex protein RnfD